MTENTSRKAGFIISCITVAVAILLICAVALPYITSIIKDNAAALGNVPTKEEILESMDSEPFEKNHISSYIKKWEFPNFEGNLIDTIEATFERYYYKEIPEESVLARATVEAFVEFCYDTTDLRNKAAVSDALVDCLIYAIGDHYAFYRTAEETGDYESDMSGNLVGIGVSVVRDNKNGTILVESVEIGSPAEGAGIQPGDYIVAVDGERVSDIGTEAALEKIRGEIGTRVRVTINRSSFETELEMIRSKIVELTVSHKKYAGGKVGYIKISSFKSNTDNQFVNAIDELERAGVEAIIFDLRNNGGGYLNSVCNMLSYLVPTNTEITSFSNSKEPIYATDGKGSEYESDGDHVLTVPSVVLCNEYSASASELFCAAMRDYNKMGLLNCTVMGKTTYKKGIMQSTLTFTDGSTLTLTTALYNPPSGINFHGVGVEPDIFLSDSADYVSEALKVLGY